jgi:membrane-associated phospholipid phosphatase
MLGNRGVVRVALVSLLALGLGGAARADVVSDWNDAALDAIRAERVPPPRASRLLAMLHVAAFDAMNAARPRYESYFGVDTPQPRGTVSPRGAFAAAAHTVLSQAFPSRVAALDALLADSLSRVPRPHRQASVDLGVAAGTACLDGRADDGSTTVVPYTPKGLPGFWAPTPPAFAPALLPNWPLVTTWVIDDGAALRPGGPPALAADAYAEAFAEVASLGRADSATRTAEQTEIALFWNDGAGTQTPPGHWNDIAKEVTERLAPLERARAMALVNLALADAAIVAWDAKYAYEHWRPITGIRAADTDGNAATAPDATWASLIPTPPFPAYTSGHSTFSAAAATVLARVLGRDDVAFSIGSDGLPGVTRSFGSFSEAASEAGQSRIYGGIHWQYDNLDGLEMGRQVGEQVAARALPRR